MVSLKTNMRRSYFFFFFFFLKLELHSKQNGGVLKKRTTHTTNYSMYNGYLTQSFQTILWYLDLYFNQMKDIDLINETTSNTFGSPIWKTTLLRSFQIAQLVTQKIPQMIFFSLAELEFEDGHLRTASYCLSTLTFKNSKVKIF